MDTHRSLQDVSDQVAIGSVTGVDLTLNIAGPGARSYAFVIDWHIRFVLAVAWMLVAGFALFGTLQFFDQIGDNNIAFSVFVVGPTVIIYFLYHPILEVLMSGSTPGKRIAGIRIVTEDGGQPGVFALLLRNVLRFLDSLPTGYLVGLIATMVTARAVRIGDIAAGTMLIYETQARQDLSSALDAYHDQASMQMQDLARELLDRWDQLDPARRTAMGRKLLAQIEPDLLADQINAQRVHARLKLFVDGKRTSGG